MQWRMQQDNAAFSNYNQAVRSLVEDSNEDQSGERFTYISVQFSSIESMIKFNAYDSASARILTDAYYFWDNQSLTQSACQAIAEIENRQCSYFNLFRSCNEIRTIIKQEITSNTFEILLDEYGVIQSEDVWLRSGLKMHGCPVLSRLSRDLRFNLIADGVSLEVPMSCSDFPSAVCGNN